MTGQMKTQKSDGPPRKATGSLGSFLSLHNNINGRPEERMCNLGACLLGSQVLGDLGPPGSGSCLSPSPVQESQFLTEIWASLAVLPQWSWPQPWVTGGLLGLQGSVDGLVPLGCGFVFQDQGRQVSGG